MYLSSYYLMQHTHLSQRIIRRMKTVMAWEWNPRALQSLSSTIHPWVDSETVPPVSCSQPMTEHITANSRARPFLGDTGLLWWLALAQGLTETYMSNGLRNFHIVFLHAQFHCRSDVHCGLSSPSFSQLHPHAFSHVPLPPKHKSYPLCLILSWHLFLRGAGLT